MISAQQPLPPADVLIANPLTEMPIAGGLVGLLDDLLVDIGFPMWLAEAVEFILLAVLLYFVLTFTLRKVVPPVVAMLVRASAVLADAILVALLLPEFALTKAMGKHTPPAAVYVYGDLVVRLTDILKSSLRRVLPPIAEVRRLPKPAVVVILIMLFAVWNQNQCSDSPPAVGCATPVEHWTALVKSSSDDK